MHKGWPKINESQTMKFPYFPVTYLWVIIVNGIWPTIPMNDHKRNIRKGIEIKYSWKNADVKKTTVDA